MSYPATPVQGPQPGPPYEQPLPARPPVRVGSILLQSVAVTIPTFSPDLDIASIANPTQFSVLKQYLFASLLFKSILTLFLDCFTLVYLGTWTKNSIGGGNSGGLVVYALCTTGSLAIVSYGGWRALPLLKKGDIQGIFVNREAYRWTCLTSKDRFLFFERVGQGYGHMDALVFFTWFTLRDWMQHILCDIPRLVINCVVFANWGRQQSLLAQNMPLTLNMPELGGVTKAAMGFNILLQNCNLIQFLVCVAVMVMVRQGKLVGLRRDEHLHTYCQRNLNVRIVRLYKLAKNHGTKAPLRDNNHLQQQLDQYRFQADEEASVGASWQTDTQDEDLEDKVPQFAYRPDRIPMANPYEDSRMESIELQRPPPPPSKE